jgi:hypothetical protein
MFALGWGSNQKSTLALRSKWFVWQKREFSRVTCATRRSAIMPSEFMNVYKVDI